MGKYITRRILLVIPTVLVISFVTFAILDLAPGDPTGNLPLSIPPEVREQIRRTLGLGEPFHMRYLKWMRQFLINEPLNLAESAFDIEIGDSANRPRVRSWTTRAPVVDLIIERIPQTLLVIGVGYVLGVLIAIPVGIGAAYKQYSLFDQVGTFVATVGYSLPTFFSGLLILYIFSVKLRWFPTFYDTTHKVKDLGSLLGQIKQSIMPVFVVTFFYTAQLSRFVRSSVLDNLQQDYVRTARSKGLRERRVLFTHVVRNSLIPVTTLVALGIPRVFTGAIITEQIFGINGLGQLMIIAIRESDIPTVQTVTFLIGILIVVFNVIADLAYGFMDPRIRYD